MAFATHDLSVLAYANGFTLWHYKSGKDDIDAVTAENYFSDAADMMARGDVVMISAPGGARIAFILEAGGAKVVTAPFA